MTRARWDELQDEYLSYRRTLLEAMAHSGPEPEESTKAAMASAANGSYASNIHYGTLRLAHKRRCFMLVTVEFRVFL